MGATNYMGVGGGKAMNASRGSSVGTSIISSSVQSFGNNWNNKMIKDNSK